MAAQTQGLLHIASSRRLCLRSAPFSSQLVFRREPHRAGASSAHVRQQVGSPTHWQARWHYQPQCLSSSALDAAALEAAESRSEEAGVLPVSSNGAPAADAVLLQQQSPAASLPDFLVALYKFSRPHTIIGTFISVCSVSALALRVGDQGAVAGTALLQAVVPALLMNICIVGLNQLYDVDIDRINKPYLPLASGELSQQQGRAIVAATGAGALVVGAAVGSPPLLATLVGSLVLGVLYSTELPFMRWKRSPVLAAACILAVRAVMVQLGFYFHMRRALESAVSYTMTRPLGFALGFMLFVSIVIALFKDIPDIQGDRQAGIFTFSVQVGAPQVFWTCISLLELAYAGAVIFGLTSSVRWSRAATVTVHIFMGGLLAVRARATDLTSSKSIYSCYMFVWKLFYAEYLFLPFLR